MTVIKMVLSFKRAEIGYNFSDWYIMTRIIIEWSDPDVRSINDVCVFCLKYYKLPFTNAFW